MGQSSIHATTSVSWDTALEPAINQEMRIVLPRTSSSSMRIRRSAKPVLLPHKEGAAAVEAMEAKEAVAVEEAAGLEVVTSIREASVGLQLEPVKSAGNGASHMRTVTNTGERTSVG